MSILRSIDAAFSTTSVTLTTTNETVIIASPQLQCPKDISFVNVLARVQLTLGTGTTAVTPRVRRGNTTAGQLVGSAVSEAVKTAAGSTEPFELNVQEERDFQDYVQYCFTLQQTAATGNGTALSAHLLIMTF
jgi:hypothetical protein